MLKYKFIIKLFSKPFAKYLFCVTSNCFCFFSKVEVYINTYKNVDKYRKTGNKCNIGSSILTIQEQLFLRKWVQ